MKKINFSNVAALLLILLGVIAPHVMQSSYLITIINAAMINSIIVIGLNFVTGLTGQMNLGTAGIMAMGAYTAAILSVHFRVTPLLGIAASLVVGLVLGLILGYPSLRVRGVYLAITTIGFTEVVRIFINNAAITGGANGLRNIPPIDIFGYQLTSARSVYYFIFAVLVLVALLAFRIVHSKWGRIFKALRDNPDAVGAAGVNIANLKILAFVLAVMLGSLGGSLYAYQIGYISPGTYTQAYSTNFVLMMIIGGSGSVAGCIIGAFAITVLPEALRFMNDYYWLFTSVVTLLFIIFLPNGIVSLFGRLGKRPRSHINLFGRKAR